MPGSTSLDRIVNLITHDHDEAISAIYLFGSHHEGSAIPTSDVDVAVVVEADEHANLREEWHAHLRETGIDNVDIVTMQRAELLRTGHFRIEHGSQLLFGADIRPELPPTTLDAYLHKYAAAPLSYIGPVLRRTDNPVNPLDYPDPDGEFFGYDRDVLAPHGTRRHNIKAMVSCACWIATMTVGYRSGRMILSPAEGVRAYRETINDEWTSLITDTYRHGRQRWHYLVPTEPEDRALLRRLCKPMVFLERHYLDVQSTQRRLRE